MQRQSRALLWASLCALLLLASCGQSGAQMQDGYYTAEAVDFDENGWKEYVTIYVNGGKITTAEYNAKNVSGLIKSWDLEYMSEMNAYCGTYPNEYSRSYVDDLLLLQDVTLVDAVSGATCSHRSFQLLAQAAIEQSLAGDKQVIYVTLPEFQVDEQE